jgi:hypothetical protein
MNGRSSVLLAAVAALFANGCYSTTIRSGLPPGEPTAGFDERWHHGVIDGIGELSGPYSLPAICPYGWSSITTYTSFENFGAGLLSLWVYTPQTVTVVCARAPAGQPASSSTTEPLPPAAIPERPIIHTVATHDLIPFSR